jgi:hypothetical protein
MPLRWSPPEQFLEYDGVKVFHTYKDELSDFPQSYWYSTSDNAAIGSECEFDVRSLPTYDPRRDVMDSEEHRNAIRAAISAQMLASNAPLQIATK